jgi:membrane protease subunit HflK
MNKPIANSALARILAKSPWGDLGGDDGNNQNSQEENIFTRPRKSPNHNFMGNWNFDFSPKMILMGLGLLAGLWMLSGIYEVKEGEEAIILRFGSFVRKGNPGLNYHLPVPIENLIIEKVNKSRRIEIGYRSSAPSRYSASTNSRDISAENTMLTGDENIVYLNADIMWHIKNLEDYTFNVLIPEETVKTAAESAIREEIGQIPISSVLSSRKQEIADRIEVLTQEMLDLYGVGVQIDQVQLLKAEPPPAVIDAYRDVQTSKADKEREINQAQSYNNDILPRARGRAAKLLEEAEGYKREVIAKAEGDTKRFNSVLEQYQKAKQVTKDRVYLETMLEVMQGRNKIITNSNVLPHLALEQNAK